MSGSIIKDIILFFEEFLQQTCNSFNCTRKNSANLYRIKIHKRRRNGKKGKNPCSNSQLHYRPAVRVRKFLKPFGLALTRSVPEVI